MPSSTEILSILTAIANDCVVVAIGWHVVLMLVVLAFVLELRPPARLATMALAAPALSVAIAAFAYGNPFNGVVFAAIATGLVSSSAAPVHAPPAWAYPVGLAAILFGAVYPHFTTGPWFASIVEAPIGLVPCPTLAVIGGFALVSSSSRATLLVLAVPTAFYAAFGVARLGVLLDLGLVIVALGLLARSMQVRVTRLAAT